MNKIEIEKWFVERAREFSLEPQKSSRTFTDLVKEYDEKYKENNLWNEREFNPVIFANLFTKVRTIAFSTKTISSRDFIQNRELLIIELNRYNGAIAMDFARILSNQSLESYNRDFYNLIYTVFSHFVEIYNNLHQYRETTIETNIRIARGYMEEAKKNAGDIKLREALQNVFDFLKLVYDEHKGQLQLCSS